MNTRTQRWLAAGAALCALAIFVRFAGHGLWGGFMPDDLMNLYRAARTPAWELVQGTLAPWAGEWRPFGFLVMKAMWASFGFHPLPYHAVALALLLVNAVLAVLLAWRLTGSGAAAAFMALLVCHHGYFSDLYLNSGTMFDTLAGTMCLGLLLAYVREPRPGAWGLAARTLIFLCALQTKEIAIFMAAALWGYELLIRRERAAWRSARQAWAFTALAAVFAAALLLHESGVINNQEYRPRFTPAVLLEHWDHYLAMMFYQPVRPGAAYPAAVLAAAAALAWLSRDAAARWAWAMAMISPLPLLAIMPRSFYAFYLPYLFWALLAAIALSRMTRKWKWAPAAVFVLIAAFLVQRHAWIQYHAESWHAGAVAELRPALTLLPAEAKRWPKGAVLLFLEDPYPADDYTLLYVAALSSGDMNLIVHRVNAGASAQGDGMRYRMTLAALERVP